MLHRLATTFCAVSSVLFMVGSGAATPYFYTDLGTLGGNSSIAYGINAGGQVTGQSDTSGSNKDGFIYNDSLPMTDLVGLGGTITRGAAINAGGSVAGISRLSGGTANHAFTYNAGTYNDLHGLLANATDSRAFALNTAGQVAGQYAFPPNPGESGTRGFFYNGLTMTTIEFGGPNYATFARALNDAGQVVGDGNGLAYIYNSATDTYTALNPAIQSILHPGDVYGGSYGYGINASGQAVGYYMIGIDPVHNYPFLYTNGTDVRNLGSLSSTQQVGRALAVNAHALVVGWSTDDSGASRAFVWNSAAGMQDLNAEIAGGVPTGWTLTQATGINDNGWIAGYATQTGTSYTHAFLLKPAMAGDADLNHTVDVADLSKVLTNYNKSEMTWADGDFDESGAVDVTDLSKVLTNYNKSGAASAGVKTVPEPGGAALLAAALAGLLAWTAKKR